MYFGKDNKGKWFVQFSYVDWTGKRIRTTKRGFKTKKEAQEYYTNFMSTKSGELNMLFGDFVDIYIADMKSRIKKNTLRTKEYIINLKILPYFGSKRINEITVSDVRQWQVELLDSGYKDTYLNTVNVQLSSIFNYACKYYSLKENPCRIAGSIGKSRANEMQIYTREQFTQFSDYLMHKRMSWIGFQILYYTGVRIGELLALQVADVDFDKKVLIIRKSYQRLDKEDIITGPKTEKGNRVINLPEFLLIDLMDYIGSMGKVKKSDRLFPTTKHFFEHEKNRAIKESGLPHIRLHDLRHSHVCRS